MNVPSTPEDYYLYVFNDIFLSKNTDPPAVQADFCFSGASAAKGHVELVSNL